MKQLHTNSNPALRDKLSTVDVSYDHHPNYHDSSSPNFNKQKILLKSLQ